MDITNTAQVEPHRLLALMKLVADLGEPQRQDVQNLLQPSVLTENKSANPQDASRSTYRIAVDCGLLTDADRAEKTTKLLVAPEQVEEMASFQQLMQQVMLNVTDENASHYLFNLYTAWYAVQNDRIFYELASKGYDGPFCSEVYPNIGDDKRPFNSTKFNAWRKWAAFLGFGWIWRFGTGTREILIPDATIRLRPLLTTVFGEDTMLSFGVFMDRVARHCPELDGGVLFNYCWQASRGAEIRGNTLSLMLSTGLRTLHTSGVLRLSEQADAQSVWHLYPAQGNPLQHVTHIEQLGA